MEQLGNQSLPWCWFSDGTGAQYVSMDTYTEKGVEITKMKLVPSIIMKNRLNIKEEDLDKEGMLEFEVETIYLVWLYHHPVYGRVFCLKDFRGRDLSYLFDESALRNQIIGLCKQIDAKNAEITRLYEDLNMVSSQQEARAKTEGRVWDALRKSGGMKRELKPEEEGQEAGEE